MKGFGWNEGDRSEYLALFAFSTIAYCSPVPRQQDKFGVDFFAHLARWKGQTLVATGNAICGQVKSDTDPILLEDDEDRRCLFEPSVPFFFVVIDKQNQSMCIYTTIERLHAHWLGWNGRMWLIPGEEGVAGQPGAAQQGDRFLYLGRPIYDKPLNVLETPADKKLERELLLSIIERWAFWEQIHLAFKAAGLPLYTRINDYATNVVPNIAAPVDEHQYYSNPNYLEGFVRGMRTHMHILHAFLGAMQEEGTEGGVQDFPAWANNVRASIDQFMAVSGLPDPEE